MRYSGEENSVSKGNKYQTTVSYQFLTIRPLFIRAVKILMKSSTATQKPV